jgi:hypothetical protein
VTTVVPSLDAGELTDKGALNQRAVLDHRAPLVAGLHEDPPAEAVIVVVETPASHALPEPRHPSRAR